MPLRRLTPLLALAWGIVPIQAGAPPMGPLGLRPPTAEEQARMDAHLIRVQQVRPNRLALSRVNAERNRLAKGQSTKLLAPLPAAAEDGAEYSGTTATGARTAVTSLLAAPATVSASTMAYPSSVDNSTEAWFPPIGSQYGGSCASFSATHYTMTSQVARLRGWDVKHDGDPAHLFSTRFIYNQINGGSDSGSWITGAYDVMETMGCATRKSLPYIDGDYVSWPTQASVWRDAIPYRMADSGSIPNIDTSAGLANAKQMLANGYILNYATDIGQWQYTSFKNDPATTADDAFFASGVPAARIKVCTHLDTTPGGSGHGMTIVGYNDDVWVDLNGNGVVDAGEKGAFRIANSWDTWWEDGGYTWISYDALKAVSAVAGGPAPSTRVAAFWYKSLYWISARASYTPTLLAEFTLETAKRNQVSLSLGRGATSATTPSVTWSPSGIQRMGGALAFNGTTTAVPATFVLDVSDLQKSEVGQRWYLNVADNAAGDAVTLSTLRFIDGGNVATECQGTNPAGGLSQSADNATLRAYADNVNYSNSAPMAQAMNLKAIKDTPRFLTLTALDANGGTLTYTVTKAPSHGTLSGTAPNLVYTPAAGFLGTDDLIFKASDGQSESSATVVIRVGASAASLASEYFHFGGISQIPDLAGRTADLTRSDAPINFTVDTDFPAEMSTDFASRHTGFVKVTDPGSYLFYLNSDDGSKLWIDETLLINNDGPHGMTEKSASITLAAGFHSVRIEYYQGGGGKGLVFKWAGPTIPKTVVPASALSHAETTNAAPVAQGRAITVPAGSITPVTLVATDVNADALEYTVLSTPSHGSLFGVAPHLSYLSDAGYTGADSFTFSVNDGALDSNTATVTLSVIAANHAPVAAPQDITIVKDTPGVIRLQATDADGNSLTYTVLTQPAHGTLSGTAPNLSYTPTSGFTGVDAFTFRASDGSLNSATATVQIHVGASSAGLSAEFFQCSGINAIPNVSGRVPDLTLVVPQITYAANGDFPATMIENFAARFTGHLKIATAGSYTLYLKSDDGSRLWIDGTQIISHDGPHGMTEKSATLTLAAGCHTLFLEYYQGGGDRGLVLSWAGPGISKAVVPASALVYVANANALPVAQPQSVVTSVNAPKTITLRATDADADADALIYTVVSQPAHGTLSGTGASLVYKPAVGFQGSDPFTFKASDGIGDSNIATVTVTVTSAPTIVNQPQSVIVTAGQKTSFSVTAGGVGPFTYQWRRDGVDIAGATASTYTTPALYLVDGGAKFSVRITTGAGQVVSNDAVVTINRAPTITPIGNQTLAEDTRSSAIAFTIGDIETPAASLSLVATTDSPLLFPLSQIVFGGSGANRTVTITPGANQTGVGNIRVRVTDAAGGTISTLFSVTVTPVSDIPTISPIADQTINQGSATAAIPFTIRDAETPADQLTLVATTDTPTLIAVANIVFGGGGSSRTVKLTPTAGQYGSARVRIRVNDANGNWNSVLFTLNVNAVNQNPTITTIANQTIPANGSSAVIPFTIGDAETTAASLSLVATTDNPTLLPISGIVFAGSGASRTVKITPAPGRTGTGKVRVRVNDPSGGTNSTLFTVTVN